ncbi:hypothetical protein HK098_008350 [Nowakowskiella sp. JEL0407]|nr:hypothetical protein HK098_008350 [Nowakowskiella sp. JEL0407]
MSDLATISIHADANFHSADIAAPVSVSTTYRFPESWNNNAAIKAGYLSQQNDAPLEEVISGENGFNLYSRYTIDSRSRVEAVLGEIENGYAVTYSSGLAAVSALIFYVAPQRILISREGYHGTHGCIGIYQRSNPSVVISYVEDMKFPLTFSSLNDIDLIWLESPQNPRGEIYDLRLFASLKPPKSILVVDSTFSPPPLQYCLAAGVDVVMHSTTKFLGGHSDLLGGALIAKDKNVAEALKNDRIYLGSVMGNFEAWLLLRSLRTLNVRVRQQSETAARLVKWIIESKENDVFSIIKKVWHASVPAHPGYDVALREKWGYSAVFSIQFKSPHHARLIVRKLKYFANATSLGGCESLIEWRAAVDSKIDPGIVRISIGLEGFEALQNDLLQAFIQVKKIVDQEFPESSLNDASAGSQPEVKPEEKPKDVFEDIYSY